jgi:Cd2+/Zn2+-exporting ATPase
VRGFKFDIDVLMVVGAVAAASMGHVWEGALLLFLFVLAGALEALAMARTTRAVEALHKLMPTKAVKWVEGAAGEAESWVEVSPESLAPGDLVKIMPGELVPTDAVVTEGVSSINQANLTGESMPRTVKPGDAVYAGTINVGDPLRAKITKATKESSLQRILDLVTSAQQQREPVQRLIDRISQPYAIGVFSVSVAVLLVWWLALGDPFSRAAFTAMTLLIVASPCAVIIATPTATLAGIARAARAGVLFKGGQSMERLSRLGAVAFDKTGTLTIGQMSVRELHPVGWSNERALLEAAAGLEQDSTHPIAEAVRAAATKQGLTPLPVKNPGFTVGRGVSGDIEGKPARLGTLVFTEELIPVCLRAKVREVLGHVQKRGQIGTVIAWNEQAGVIILSDVARPGAERLVKELHQIGVRPVVMLTGDNRGTAQAVAESLGLDRFEAELLPQDKVDAVQKLKAEIGGHGTSGSQRAVGVIGDGVNDAPALAGADVSIAIGSIGSDAALESADIVLLADDLGVIPWAVRLARRTRKTILFNLTFALSAIALMVVATLIGSRIGRPLPLWMGVLGHEGGTLLVVFNSLLLLAARGSAAESLIREPPEVGVRNERLTNAEPKTAVAV